MNKIQTGVAKFHTELAVSSVWLSDDSWSGVTVMCHSQAQWVKLWSNFVFLAQNNWVIQSRSRPESTYRLSMLYVAPVCCRRLTGVSWSPGFGREVISLSAPGNEWCNNQNNFPVLNIPYESRCWATERMWHNVWWVYEWQVPEEALWGEVWADPPPLLLSRCCRWSPPAQPLRSLQRDTRVNLPLNRSAVLLQITDEYMKTTELPLLACRGDASSSSSSSRFLWSLLTSAMRRERSEKSSADWTQRDR